MMENAKWVNAWNNALTDGRADGRTDANNGGTDNAELSQVHRAGDSEITGLAKQIQY